MNGTDVERFCDRFCRATFTECGFAVSFHGSCSQIIKLTLAQNAKTWNTTKVTKKKTRERPEKRLMASAHHLTAFQGKQFVIRLRGESGVGEKGEKQKPFFKTKNSLKLSENGIEICHWERGNFSPERLSQIACVVKMFHYDWSLKQFTRQMLPSTQNNRQQMPSETNHNMSSARKAMHARRR